MRSGVRKPSPGPEAGAEEVLALKDHPPARYEEVTTWKVIGKNG
jgi:hypothetical protein